MQKRRFLEIGGLVAGVVLVVFGAAAIYMGVDGRSTVRDSVKQEQIFFGEASDPAVARYAPQWAGAQVVSGEQARAFAKVMREHTLESSGGLTYAEMGRFQSAAALTTRRARATRPQRPRMRPASPSRTPFASSGSPRPPSRQRST